MKNKDSIVTELSDGKFRINTFLPDEHLGKIANDINLKIIEAQDDIIIKSISDTALGKLYTMCKQEMINRNMLRK